MPSLLQARRDPRLIVPLEIDPHNELHKNVALVPPLSHHLAGRALRLFNDRYDEYDPVANLENYMSSIEEAAKHPRAQELERAMAALTVHACELQIPFIKEGYVDLEQYGNRR